jgi:hypothetical protein
MSSKEQAERIINSLREKGFSDEDISAAVVGFLSEMNSK